MDIVIHTEQCCNAEHITYTEHDSHESRLQCILNHIKQNECVEIRTVEGNGDCKQIFIPANKITLVECIHKTHHAYAHFGYGV